MSVCIEPAGAHSFLLDWNPFKWGLLCRKGNTKSQSGYTVLKMMENHPKCIRPALSHVTQSRKY